MRICKRLMALTVCCLMILSLGIPAHAAQSEGPCALTIRYVYEEQPLTGAQFQIFRVGGVDEYGDRYLDGNFKDYPVDITTEDMAALAETLYGYAMIDQIVPEYQVTIDESGTAVVSDMPEGIYLVIGLKHSDEVNDYITKPQMIILPSWNAAGEWSYSTVLNPKGSIETRPVKLKVLKQWEDNGNEQLRPVSIDVTLLQDGEVYETITLNAENNWRYTWEALPGGSMYTVVEDVPEGYTVSYHQEGITYVIVNTCDAPPPTTEPPPPELPDTGLVWWPVPAMAGLGLVLIVLGMADRRGDYDEA